MKLFEQQKSRCPPFGHIWLEKVNRDYSISFDCVLNQCHTMDHFPLEHVMMSNLIFMILES